jgi:hypothetical protein
VEQKFLVRLIEFGQAWGALSALVLLFLINVVFTLMAFLSMSVNALERDSGINGNHRGRGHDVGYCHRGD